MNRQAGRKDFRRRCNSEAETYARGRALGPLGGPSPFLAERGRLLGQQQIRGWDRVRIFADAGRVAVRSV